MLVDSLMQQLLSKEVLYQPMKDIACKYPEWLEKNRAALTDEEFQKYSKQHESILSVCALYEQETTDFDKLVQVMQEVGRLPPSLDGGFGGKRSRRGFSR